MTGKRIIAVDLDALRALHDVSLCSCYDCQIARARALEVDRRRPGAGADRWHGRDRNV